MSVSVKSNREIELMREAGKILGTVLNELSKEIKPGMTTHLLEPVRDGITTIFCICLRCLLYREITGSIRNDDSKMRYWERRRKWDTVRK